MLWTSQRLIPYHKKNKRIYFLKSEIDEWLKTGRRKTTAEIHAEAIAYVNRKAKLNKDLADNYKQKNLAII